MDCRSQLGGEKNVQCRNKKCCIVMELWLLGSFDMFCVDVHACAKVENIENMAVR
jgi:hypothetical protein